MFFCLLNTGHHQLYAMVMLAIHQAAMKKTLHQDARIRIAKVEPVYFV
jgi:hypothetical protein